jgi:hypothetical protein
MKIVTGTTAELSATLRLAEALWGPPKKGRHTGGGTHAEIPETLTQADKESGVPSRTWGWLVYAVQSGVGEQRVVLRADSVAQMLAVKPGTVATDSATLIAAQAAVARAKAPTAEPSPVGTGLVAKDKPSTVTNRKRKKS